MGFCGVVNPCLVSLVSLLSHPWVASNNDYVINYILTPKIELNYILTPKTGSNLALAWTINVRWAMLPRGCCVSGTKQLMHVVHSYVLVHVLLGRSWNTSTAGSHFEASPTRHLCASSSKCVYYQELMSRWRRRRSMQLISITIQITSRILKK